MGTKSEKVTKKTPKVVTVDSTETINDLLDRVAKLEQKNLVLGKSFRKAGNTLKSYFGFAAVGAVFTALAEQVGDK